MLNKNYVFIYANSQFMQLDKTNASTMCSHFSVQKLEGVLQLEEVTNQPAHTFPNSPCPQRIPDSNREE